MRCAACSIAESLEPRTLLSGAALVYDVNHVTATSNPGNFVVAGNELFFSADDGIHGNELWKSDGTTAGTTMMAGAGSSSPHAFAALGTGVFFTTATGGLWFTNGTAAGTMELSTVAPSSSNWTIANGRLYFEGTNAQSGSELWVSDGTVAGTHILDDIDSGSASSSPSNFAQVNGEVYFAASTPSSGNELWKTDGTAAGTAQVADINPGVSSSNPQALTAMNGKLYFTALNSNSSGGNLYVSDGTSGGTQEVSTAFAQGFSFTPVLGVLGNHLFFTGSDTHGEELWISDGTAAGTMFFKDLVPGSASPGFFSPFFDFNGKAYFWANNQFWQTDGTSSGTVPIATVSQPVTLAVSTGTYLYFESPYNGQLWRTDGTSAGTTLFASNLPYFSVFPPNLVNLNGELLLNGLGDPHASVELTSLAPGSSQFTTVKDINLQTPFGSDPQDFIRAGNQVFFVANDGTGSYYQLWVTDGTAANTRYLKTLSDVFDGLHNNVRFIDAPLGNSLLFMVQNQLWISDGTTAGTVMVKDLESTNLESPDIQSMVTAGKLVYFAAWDGGLSTGTELWASDGTAAGTHVVDDISPGTASSSPNNLGAVGNTLYFEANDGVHGNELWKSDGTAQGTTMVIDANPGAASSNPREITDVAGTLYLVMTDASGSPYLWKSDGTAAGTSLVLDADGQPLYWPEYMTAVGSELYFSGGFAATGFELWKSDGTANGTMLVDDIVPGSAGSYPRYLTAMGGDVYFNAIDSNGQGELFKSDGTAAGTIQLTHGLTYSTSGVTDYIGIRSLTAAGNILFFAADDGTHGDEVWRSDGTAAGTVLVQDVGPGDSLDDSAYAVPQFTALGNIILFAANDHQVGTELWRADKGSALRANAGGPYQVSEGQTLTVSAAGSVAPDAPIVSYEWDLNYSGNGGMFTVDATGVTATLSGLDGPSTRTVAVRVTDADGNVSIGTAQVQVLNVPPALNISGPPVISTASPTFILSLSSSDPGPDTISNWAIYWGDGTAQVVTGNPPSVSHVYPGVAATYTISATATDEDGTYNLQSIPIGAQDPHFGTNGIASNSGIFSGSRIAIQGDGKIISVGAQSSGIVITRHNADGSIDTTFGNGGNVVSVPTAGTLRAEAVALQSDGNIMVAGTLADSTGTHWIIDRFLPDGSQDPTYDAGKWWEVMYGNNEDVAGIAVRPDDSFVIAGSANYGAGGINYVVASYTAAGLPDTTFGAGAGFVVTDLSGGTDHAAAVAIQADGKIIVAGTQNQDTAPAFGLVRYTASGALDSSFGSGGIVLSPYGMAGAQQVFSMILQPDGKILVGGGGQPAYAALSDGVFRYNSDGSLDQTFGNNSAEPGGWTNGGYDPGYIVAMALQSDGQILMLNSGTPCVGRLTASGKLDLTFGNAQSTMSGFSVLNVNDALFKSGDMALQPNGAIIVAGNGSTGSDLIRVGGLTSGASVRVAPNNASISGTYFYDFNGNGIWDSGEGISPSWGVFLDTNGDGIYEAPEPELICNSQGQYTFSNLLPGTYRVHPTSAAKWTETAPPGGTQFVTVSAGQVVKNINFGEVRGAATATASSTPLFTGTSYSVNLAYAGFHSVTSWTLNWGDGSVQTITGSPASASHTYASASGTSPFTILAWANTVDGDAPAAPLTLAVYAAPLLNNGLLSLTGTSGNDSVSFTNSGGLLTLNLNGATKQYNSSAVTKVSYSSNGGNDTINLSGAIPATLNLASGNCTITNNDSAPVFVAASTGKTTINASSGTTIIPANSGTGIQQLDFAAINISSGAKVVFANSSATLGDYSLHANRTLAIVDAGGLNIASGGTLDIGDNSMLLKYLAANKSATDSMVNSLLSSGFAGQAWNGTGINSSEASYDAYFGSASRAVAWADQLDVGVNSFEGDSADVADGNEIMIKFTYYGDTDLDGKVAASDSAAFSNGVHLPSGSNAYWEFGDMDYSGGDPTASDSQSFSTGLAAYKTFGQL